MGADRGARGSCVWCDSPACRAAVLLVAFGVTRVWSPSEVAPQDVRPVRITDRGVGGPEVEMRELYRVGSRSGQNDAFGRVMSAALDQRGYLFVADDQVPTVAVFDSGGRFVRHLARRGAGPGEIERPWLVAVDQWDSVFVYDHAQARVSVFGPGFVFARTIRVPTAWLVTSMAFAPSGAIVVAAFGAAETKGVHVLRRDGSLSHSFGDVRVERLSGFESSLLGGSIDVLGTDVVYSRKSPYELLFFSGGTLTSHCLGPESLTTRPRDVLDVVPGQGVGLRWSAYRHSASVLFIDRDLVVNVIVDPGLDRHVVDLVTRDCRLIRRTRLGAPVTLVDRVGNRVAAVGNLEFPEVIVYSLRVVR